MKKILKILSQRVGLVALALIIQIFVLVAMILKFNTYFIYFYALCIILSLLALLTIINNKSNPSYKMAWIIPILIFPIFGGLFYVMFGRSQLSKRLKRKMDSMRTSMQMADSLKNEVTNKLKCENLTASKQSSYIEKMSGSPIYNNIYIEYYSVGEDMYPRLKEELLKAKHYIFLEFFIIEEGIMWNSILDILIENIKEGVDVRVMYDDMGCITTLPYKYSKKLEKLGIKCCVFNPFIPVLSIRMNNRDHRKIVVIDGHTGFTGGFNLADEYINLYPKHGHWKDSAILLKGNAVWSLTVMFLSMWDYVKGINENYDKYRPGLYNSEEYKTKGYIQPYNDNPLDDETVGECIYLNLINNANKYIYITTPYLIIDNEMITSLTLAAKSGVDVRIITPGIPDKKIVNELTKSYYEVLIESGVKIYEYTPGFIHAKNFVVDDLYATVGTVNLDYRSLYLHFECGVWVYNNDTVFNVKKDFEETLTLCREITLKDCKKISGIRRFLRAILRVFAPLM